MKLKGCFLHQSDLWKTPSKIYKHFMERGYFDPCPVNPEFDGLNIEWKLYNFVNPPYSQIDEWLEKAYMEREKEHYSVFLLPVRSDTKWFRKLMENGCCIVLIQGRLKFNDTGSAPFPSMFVVINEFNSIELRYINKETLEELMK